MLLEMEMGKEPAQKRQFFESKCFKNFAETKKNKIIHKNNINKIINKNYNYHINHNINHKI